MSIQCEVQNEESLQPVLENKRKEARKSRLGMPGFEEIFPCGEGTSSSVDRRVTWNKLVSSPVRLEKRIPCEAEDVGEVSLSVRDNEGSVAHKAEMHVSLREVEDGGTGSPSVPNEEGCVACKAEMHVNLHEAEDGGTRSPCILEKKAIGTCKRHELVTLREAKDGGARSPGVQSKVTTTAMEAEKRENLCEA